MPWGVILWVVKKFVSKSKIDNNVGLMSDDTTLNSVLLMRVKRATLIMRCYGVLQTASLLLFVSRSLEF